MLLAQLWHMHVHVVRSGRVLLNVSSKLALHATGSLDGTHQMSAYAYQVGNSSIDEICLVMYTGSYVFIAIVL